MRYEVNEVSFQEIINIKTGLFSPLEGFMNLGDYRRVIDDMKLVNGSIWTIPITLDIPKYMYTELNISDDIILTYDNKDIAVLKVADFYEISTTDIKAIYQTDDMNHPGVKQELSRYIYRVGGKISLIDMSILDGALNPQETKKLFLEKKWTTIVGFQTRNVVHRAHEYLHRIGLEFCDGLFINPLVGWKKIGDFSEQAVENGYKVMIEKYYSGLNIYFNTLKTPMRYAGPREAIFHAILRKNLGCTHFIIGRDHAGVGNYYEKYAAHKLAKQIIKKDDLGIELLLLKEPYYCNVCEQMVSENCCSHKDIVRISGTQIRDTLSRGMIPSLIYMRKEVAEEIIKLDEGIFIK